VSVFVLQDGKSSSPGAIPWIVPVVSLAPVTLGAGAPLLPRHIEGMRVVSVDQRGQRIDIHYTLDRHAENASKAT